MTQLVLASSSPYRRELLERLGVAFETASPNVDESPITGEKPEQLVSRLAESKAKAVVESFPQSLIIGSDQVAVLDDQILGKPGEHEVAVQQLSAASGKTVKFLTGLCLLNASTNNLQTSVEEYSVTFRKLSTSQIEYYLQKEQPYDCAGSFKSEGLGISLFEKMAGDDPNSLVGLPLMALIRMLSIEDVDVLSD